MDSDFIATTFVRLIAALPLTLAVWFLSVVLGGAHRGGRDLDAGQRRRSRSSCSRAAMSSCFAARRC